MSSNLARVPRRRSIVALAALGLVMTSVGLAAAAIPDSGGVITGCYDPHIGVVRVIDTGTGQKCLRVERQLTWNQKGQPGAPGAAGPRGPAGTDGKDGINGKDGLPGADGAPGQIGPSGPVGPQGDKGETGAIGATGPQGPAGPVGEKGEKGDTGSPGAAGTTGPAGPAGVSGMQIVTETTNGVTSGGGALAFCPIGTKPIGGGLMTSPVGGLSFSMQTSSPTGQFWRVDWNYPPPASGSNTPRTVTVYAICAIVN